MILSEKLLKLRTAAGLSQEELAEKMNVSRQSISKWESGSSIPGIDRILELCKFYGVTADFLLQDEIEELPTEVVVREESRADVRRVSMEEAGAYLALSAESAKHIALGVMLCILSPIALIVLCGLSGAAMLPFGESLAVGLGVAVLLVNVALGVVIFILNGMKLDEYEYLEKEPFRLEYGVAGILEKGEKEYQPVFAKGVALGVAMCILSCVPLLICMGSESPVLVTAMVGVLLAIVACGVYFIVRVAIHYGAYSELLQKGEHNVRAKKKNKKLEAFNTAYWCLITGGYLSVSFLTNSWSTTWVIWPVAGVLYAAIDAILDATLCKEN